MTVLLHLPLKQGLKPGEGDQNWIYTPKGSFTSSIKTRIETYPELTSHFVDQKVLLHLPLKQGLKQYSASFLKNSLEPFFYIFH